MRLDGKVHGTIIKNKDGKEIPEDEFIVFRPADNALLPTLRYYLNQCELEGAAPEQITAVEDLIARVLLWRTQHPDRCKIPDVEPGELQS